MNLYNVILKEITPASSLVMLRIDKEILVAANSFDEAAQKAVIYIDETVKTVSIIDDDGSLVLNNSAHQIVRIELSNKQFII